MCSPKYVFMFKLYSLLLLIPSKFNIIYVLRTEAALHAANICKKMNFEEKLIYVHFQKTAGTSVESGLKLFVHELNSICSTQKIFERPSGSAYRKNLFTKSEKMADIVAGHGYWGCHNKLNSSANYAYSAFFRDPLKRALSHHARSSCKTQKKCSITKFAHLHARNYYYNRLVYPDGLVGGGKYGEKLQGTVSTSVLRRNRLGLLLDTARRNIDEMKFIGIVEEFDASMFLFGKYLSRFYGIASSVEVNLHYCTSPNSFKSTYEIYKDSIKGQLTNLFRVDSVIFEYATKKFHDQVLSYGASFDSDLKDFQEKQRRYEENCCASGRKTSCVGLHSITFT